MLVIDIKNVEELIFFNNKLRRKFPEFKRLFRQWAMGKQFPHLRFASQKAILTFLERLKDKHIAILEQHFDTKVKISVIDYKVVKDIKVPIEKLEETLCNMEGFSDNYSISRDQDHVYISFWR